MGLPRYRRKKPKAYQTGIFIVLVIVLVILVIQLWRLDALRDRWQSEYDKAASELARVTAERDELRRKYEGVMANQCDYWNMHGVPPDYVVYLDDGICYAENVSNGEVIASKDPVEVIQAAIKSLPSSGGKILIRTGTYILSTHLTDSGNDFVILQGEGWNTTLRIADNTQKTVIDIRGQRGWIISDIAIDGNKANNVQVPGGVPNDMNQNGIHLFQVTESKIIRVYVHDTVFHGINIHYQSTDNLVQDCLVERCGTKGDYGASSGILVFSSSPRNVVRRNRLIDNHARGIYISAYSSDCIVSDNLIIGGRSEAGQGIIVMDHSDRVELRNNAIYDTPGSGIDVGNRYGPAYNGVLILDNTIIRAGFSGIWCGPGGGNATIVGNQITDAGHYAIWTQGWGGRILNNTIYSSLKLGILAEDEGTEESGNIILN